MALFDENMTVSPAPVRRRPRTTVVGIWAVSVAVVVLLILTFLPTAYVIQRPGPVFDTLGSAPNQSGKEVPLISVSGAQTYPTDGALYLLTVQVVGDRQHTPSWLQLAGAWFDPSRAVVPIDAVFPQGQTTQERDQESAEMMVDSQKEATAAALTELGYTVTSKLTVYSLVDGSAAQGILMKGDVITEANGTKITDADTLRDVIAKGEGDPVALTIVRDGHTQNVTVTPKKATVDGKTTWLIGVTLITDFDFPIDVTLQLDNVGGPSAGMMFALGIIDTLTPGSLNGGKQVAGTGTIDAKGDVGAIGGIRQKMYGAKDAGATYFLAPQSNCDEVVGHIPAGLRVFSVKTLDDSLRALKAISAGTGMDALPTCTGS
ncbi:PDZ domain-containing protein [Microbacterium sp.]|uniref:YlbL family protein n=1 Tax=Microbacterium sp. TaxID=51671 RepID=UPI003A9189E1